MAQVVTGGRRGEYYVATSGALAPAAFVTAAWCDPVGEEYGGVLVDV